MKLISCRPWVVQLEPQRPAHGQVLPGRGPQRAHARTARPRTCQHAQRVLVDLGVHARGQLTAVPEHLPDLGQ